MANGLIFCIECKYFIADGNDCNHPDNVTYSWKQITGTMAVHPKDINTNNDCKWFEAINNG